MKTTTIKTKEKSELTLLGNIISIMFFIFEIIFMTFTIFILTYNKPIVYEGKVMNEIDGTLMYNLDIKYKIGIILLIGVIFIFFPIATFLGNIIGTATAKHKIKKDENFINDFGSFASKNPEEIIVWDRYLSYAAMLENTKKNTR